MPSKTSDAIAALFGGISKGIEAGTDIARFKKENQREDARLELYKKKVDLDIKSAEMQKQISELTLRELRAKYAVATPEERQQLAWNADKVLEEAKINDAQLDVKYGEKERMAGIAKDETAIDANKAETAYKKRLTANVGANNRGDTPRNNERLVAAQGLYKMWSERVDDMEKILLQPNIPPEQKAILQQKKAEALQGQEAAAQAIAAEYGQYNPGAMPPRQLVAPATEQKPEQEPPSVPPDLTTLTGQARGTVDNLMKTGGAAASNIGKTLGGVANMFSTINKKAIPFMQGKIGTYTLADGQDADLSKWSDEDIQAAEAQGLIKKRKSPAPIQGAGIWSVP